MNVEINLSMKGSSGMVNIMVKGHTLGLMEANLLENGRMDYEMVKQHSLILMVERMLVSGEKTKNGIQQRTVLTEQSLESL
jgi:hypothetical protein